MSVLKIRFIHYNEIQNISTKLENSGNYWQKKSYIDLLLINIKNIREISVTS